MVFSGLTFLLFFLPLFLALYFIIPSLKWKNAVILVFSLVFYAWGEPVYVLLMIGVTLLNYLLALCLGRAKRKGFRKLWLALAVIISISGLALFKYAAFFINSVFALAGIPASMEPLHLPIGISFYTFQILTYTVDVYRKKTPVQRSFFKLLLYVSCFPQLIAGPIVQYGDVAEAIDRRSTCMEDFSRGMQRFVVGLSKKVLLANLCGEMLNATTQAGTGAQLSVLGAWMGAFLYSLQLYFDFSAYSDMAIGLGQVMGFRYKENFNYPYIASSATDFWRRWHMSLSGFFRDYVYIPLGGNRKGNGRTALNMLVVWALTGLWHGASWNFVLWGLYYFVVLCGERFLYPQLLEKLPGIIRHIYAPVIIMVGWVLFYYTDLSAAVEHLFAMFGFAKTAAGFVPAALYDEALLTMLKTYTVLPAVGLLCCLPIVPGVKKLLSRSRFFSGVGELVSLVLLTGLFLLSLAFLVGQSYNPFIYFRF